MTLAARRLLAAGLLVFVWTAPVSAQAANCARTSSGLVALPDLAQSTYLGRQGGLYPGGRNDPPAPYAEAGRQAAAAITPRVANGHPAPDGKIALLSIGMSNTHMEFAAFIALVQADPQRNPQVVLVDGAQGGRAAASWSAASAAPWAVVEERLRQAGVTDAQVQAIWLKQADAGPTSDFPSYTGTLHAELAAIVSNAVGRFPNLQQVYVSPRTYGGYATTRLNPEPYAYQTGFADKLLVADSIAKPNARPWIGWGPYLWTDGTKGRRDGIVWTCDDVQPSDGTHPSPAGQRKVAAMLQSFYAGSPFATWYRAGDTNAATRPHPASAPPGGLPLLPLLAGGGALLAVIGVAGAARRKGRGNSG